MVVGSEMSDCLEEMIHGLRNERDQARSGILMEDSIASDVNSSAGLVRLDEDKIYLNWWR